MKEPAGTAFSIARRHPAVPGCTTSVATHESVTLGITHFSLAKHTDISAESYAEPRLIIVDADAIEAYGTDAARQEVQAGSAILLPTGKAVGIRTEGGAVYTELHMKGDAHMNDAIKAGKAFKLADLVPYQEGTIVNMDVARNDGMKLALMSFDAGCSLSEHAAPGEALIFALDGEGVIGYEGEEHVIHAGENFKFDKGDRHYVRTDRRFKMALLLTLE